MDDKTHIAPPTPLVAGAQDSDDKPDAPHRNGDTTCGCKFCWRMRASAYEMALLAARSMFKAIVKVDKTTYAPGERRAGDGAATSDPRVTWRSPKSIAIDALSQLEPWIGHVVDCTDPDPIADADPT